MNKLDRQAIAIAIKAIRAQIQRVAFDANAAVKYGFTNPTARNALARKKRLESAIKRLEDLCK